MPETPGYGLPAPTQISVNVPAEWSFRVRNEADVYARDLDVMVTGGGGQEWRVPAFWAGEDRFGVRFAAPQAGGYRWKVCGDSGDVVSGAEAGEFEAVPYDRDNTLYRHGRLRVGGRTLTHTDGTPFFWLGDTWWYGLSPRLPWPSGFRELTADRVGKGFNVVQIVVGPGPMISGPGPAWHPHQANEGGFAWEPGFSRLNPRFYDAADLRVGHLVEAGIVPCIFAMWGSFLTEMGVERVRRHWRNLVARYAAYPVVLCLCGEADLAVNRETRLDQRRGWTSVARYLRELDPFHNLVTIHPAYPESRTVIDDDSLIDLNMLQTSHFGYDTPSDEWLANLQAVLELEERPRFGLEGAVENVIRAVTRQPPMPTINAEPAYEGHWGANWQDVQRVLFWTNVLSGAVGHTYGAQGIWNMNSVSDPWLPSPRYPGSGAWQEQGAGTWQEAMHYAGGRQVALGRRFFERYRWWAFQPLFEEEARRAGRPWSFAAGIPGEISVLYLGSTALAERLQGLPTASLLRGADVDVTIPLDGPRRVVFFDPRTGEDIDAGVAAPGSGGRWPLPLKPTDEDWVLVLEAPEARDGNCPLKA